VNASRYFARQYFAARYFALRPITAVPPVEAPIAPVLLRGAATGAILLPENLTSLVPLFSKRPALLKGAFDETSILKGCIDEVMVLQSTPDGFIELVGAEELLTVLTGTDQNSCVLKPEPAILVGPSDKKPRAKGSRRQMVLRRE
jgi:hypothetical protein